MLKEFKTFIFLKNITVLIFKDVNGNGHVPRLFWTRVYIPIILRNKINIMKNKTLKSVLA